MAQSLRVVCTCVHRASLAPWLTMNTWSLGRMVSTTFTPLPLMLTMGISMITGVGKSLLFCTVRLLGSSRGRFGLVVSKPPSQIPTPSAAAFELPAGRFDEEAGSLNWQGFPETRVGLNLKATTWSKEACQQWSKEACQRTAELLPALLGWKLFREAVHKVFEPVAKLDVMVPLLDHCIW